MREKSFNYYGYEKITYEDCTSLISSMNIRHMEILNLWFIVITSVYLFFSWQNSYGFSGQNAPVFLVLFLGEAVFEIILLKRREYMEAHLAATIYINMISLIVFGIICSSAQPYMAGTMYPVILVLVALSYITTMLQMTAFLVLSSIGFVIVSYVIKPGSIFNQDIFNVLVVLILSIILHYTFQRARIRQFITYRHSEKMQQELEIKSSFDSLTSLLNRGRFFSMASDVLRKRDEEGIVLAIMDLDKFKQINDSLGHQMGDKVIQVASRTILDVFEIEYGDKWSFPERAVREGLSFAGRLGGDEFVVLIRNIPDEEKIEEVFEKMLSALNSVKLNGIEGIYASIGVTKISDEDVDLDMVYSRADAALYRSKEAGRNQIYVITNNEKDIIINEEE